jgi:hypothetical protein
MCKWRAGWAGAVNRPRERRGMGPRSGLALVAGLQLSSRTGPRLACWPDAKGEGLGLHEHQVFNAEMPIGLVMLMARG